MIRASIVLPAGSWDRSREQSHIALPYDGRHRRRMTMTAAGGLEFLLDLAEAHALRDGDGLVLEDGRVVRVVASPEPVADVTGPPHLLLRVAWHIGNRHIPCELLPDRIRIARDHVLQAMVRGLGAEVALVEAPFQPEPGAYAQGAHQHAHQSDDPVREHDHAHGHTHRHDHGHEQHEQHEHGAHGGNHPHGR